MEKVKVNKQGIALDNIKATKKLIKKYRDLTVEKIEEIKREIKEEKGEISGYYVVQKYSGFGNPSECSLCNAVSSLDGKECDKCIHLLAGKGLSTYCLNVTYKNVSKRIQSRAILRAVYKRAGYLEKLLSKVEK